MHLKLFLSCLFICILLPANSQTPSLMRATLGMGGVSVLPSTYKNSYVIQSIGQLSVPGVFRGNEIELRQGFIQPVKVKMIRSYSEDQNIIIWPNPFSDRIFISLNNIPEGVAELTVTDIAGRVVHSEMISAEKVLSVNLSSLSRGIFFINIRKKNLQYNTKIIKN